MEQKIRERIEQLKQQRAAFVEQANRQLVAFDGAIQALEGLLVEDESGDVDGAMAKER
jgi:hypothetical protein